MKLKRSFAIAVTVAGLASGAAASPASAAEGEMHVPIAYGCGGSVYWNTGGDPIAYAYVNNPDGCVDKVREVVVKLFASP
jgi:hypothetical protein